MTAIIVVASIVLLLTIFGGIMWPHDRDHDDFDDWFR